MKLATKFFVGEASSSLVMLDDGLRTLGLALSIIVALLSIASLAWDLHRKVKRGKK